MDWFAWYLVGFRQWRRHNQSSANMYLLSLKGHLNPTLFSAFWSLWHICDLFGQNSKKTEYHPSYQNFMISEHFFFTFTWLVRHQRGKFCIALWWNDDKGSLNPWIPYSLIHNFTRGSVGRLFICSKRRITSLIVLHFLSSAPQAYAHLQHTARLFRKMLKLGCEGYISEASLMWNQKPMSSREADAVSFHHKL